MIWKARWKPMRATRPFVVQGITFHVTKKTDYDDGLRQFQTCVIGA